MRAIICGTRNFDDYTLLEATLYELNWDIDCVLSGEHKGADRLGEKYAKAYGFQIERFPLDKDDNDSARYIRNATMIKRADALIAFWDGNSRGTWNLIKMARGKRLKTKVVIY